MGKFMKEVLIGATAAEEVIVTDACTAISAGSGSLAVFGTPFMIALMEKATCSAVASFLEEGETTVGTNICVSHNKASGIGEKITARAELVKAEGRKLTFRVSAANEKAEIIGEGEIERFAVLSDKFMKRVHSN